MANQSFNFKQIRAWNDNSISIKLHSPLYNNFQYLGWIISNNLTVDEKFPTLHVCTGYDSRVADRKQRLCTDIGELLAREDKQWGVYIHLNHNWLFSVSYKSVICMHFYTTRKTLQCIKIIVYKFFIHGQNNRSRHVVHNTAVFMSRSGWGINYSWASRAIGWWLVAWLVAKIFCSSFFPTKYSITWKVMGR